MTSLPPFSQQRDAAPFSRQRDAAPFSRSHSQARYSVQVGKSAFAYMYKSVSGKITLKIEEIIALENFKCVIPLRSITICTIYTIYKSCLICYNDNVE